MPASRVIGRPRREASLLLVLSLAAGSVDALTYLGLGRVFTANMTGNTVLLGVAVAEGSSADAFRALVALGGFCLGGAAGMLMTSRGRQPWPRLTWPLFALETAALAALLAAWQIAGVASLRYLLIVLSGIAMGVQSAAVRVSNVPGVNTTYMTSTLLNALSGVIVRGKRPGSEPHSRLPGAAWAIYAVGALAGAAAEKAWGAAAVAISLSIVAGVTAATAWWARSERPGDERRRAPHPGRGTTTG